MNPAIEVRGIQYTFAGQELPILRGVSFTVGHGEAVGIVGHNGSGKSTLLRIVSTLLAPQQGEVFFDGQESARVLSDVRPRISYSAGAPLGFYPRLTGEENLRLFASFRGQNLSSLEAKRLMRRAGLDTANMQIYFNYSLGMRQRLHLARLCLKPHDYVFVDEPSNGLDADGMSLLEDMFANELGACTRLIISHDHELLERMTSRRMLLKEGYTHEL
jgi:ABC-2 type transport system ATP-binding protein